MKVGNIYRRITGKEISLNRVRDSITIREGDEKLKLYVDSDANGIIRRIQAAQEALSAITDESMDTEREEAAKRLSDAIFGEEQTKKLVDFYHGDYGCVITICGIYFGDYKNGLGKKITKAQKRNR